MISPIPVDLLTQQMRFGDLAVAQENVYWTEGRALEGGRSALMWLDHEGTLHEIAPSSYNVRTRVHEYGGGAFGVHGETVVFSNFSDNALYLLDKEIKLIASGARYADFSFSPDGKTLYCVIEKGRENGIARIDLTKTNAVQWIVSGADFYSSPRVSPDGKFLAYISWNFPNMPWDHTQLSILEIGTGKKGEEVAGQLGEALMQPAWSSKGELYFISDRSGYWNLYRYAHKKIEAVAPQQADIGDAQWVFGGSDYALTPNGIAISRTVQGVDELVFIDEEGETPLSLPYNDFSHLHAIGNDLVCFAGGPVDLSSLIRIDLKTKTHQVLCSSDTLKLDPQTISKPEIISFPTENGKTAYGFYYAPISSDGPPPLLMNIHGGPTSRAIPRLNLHVQYWTSRGFAFFDLNYGGSTGYGREYRERLNGQWGVVDIADAEHAARYLINSGKADPKKIAIRGGSAGGYTSLLALTKSKTFSGAASYFGVVELELLAKDDDHKFESRYLDILIGPYPEKKELYIERSPITYIDQFSTPLILFQGGEDKIVPPAHSDHLYQALKKRGVDCEYLLFPHEGHGFRSAEAIKKSIEAESAFYHQINFH